MRRAELMAEMKPQVYKDPRPAEYFDALPRARAQGRSGLDLRARPDRPHARRLMLLYRARAIGLENVPPSGPGDPRAQPLQPHGPLLRRASTCAARSSSWPSRSSSGSPILSFIFTHGGVFPVRRGHRDEEAFMTAHTILDRGGMRADVRRGRPLAHAASSASRKRGVGRLALESGAPVVPVAIHGSAERAQLEAAAVPEGHGPVRRAARFAQVENPTPRAAAGGRRRGLRRGRASSTSRSRRTAAADVLKALREGLPDGSPEPTRQDSLLVAVLELRRRSRGRGPA